MEKTINSNDKSYSHLYILFFLSPIILLIFLVALLINLQPTKMEENIKWQGHPKYFRHQIDSLYEHIIIEQNLCK